MPPLTLIVGAMRDGSGAFPPNTPPNYQYGIDRAKLAWSTAKHDPGQARRTKISPFNTNLCAKRGSCFSLRLSRSDCKWCRYFELSHRQYAANTTIPAANIRRAIWAAQPQSKLPDFKLGHYQNFAVVDLDTDSATSSEPSHSNYGIRPKPKSRFHGRG